MDILIFLWTFFKYTVLRMIRKKIGIRKKKSIVAIDYLRAQMTKNNAPLRQQNSLWKMSSISKIMVRWPMALNTIDSRQRFRINQFARVLVMTCFEKKRKNTKIKKSVINANYQPCHYSFVQRTCIPLILRVLFFTVILKQ